MKTNSGKFNGEQVEVIGIIVEVPHGEATQVDCSAETDG